MEKIDELIILFDYYSELFTEKQKIIFNYYYFELRLYKPYRVHKTLKIVEKKLYDYECKLKLFCKRKKIINLIDKIGDKDIKNKIIDNI